MSIIEFLQSFLSGEGWLSFFLWVTHLGDAPAYVFFLSLYFWLVSPRHGRQLALLFALSIVSNFLIKNIFMLPRPYVLNPDVATVEALATAGSFSFPSGHAQGIVTFWGAIACVHKKVWLWICALLIIAVVCTSRMYLGVHFPVDIAAGTLLGIFWITLGLWIGRIEIVPIYQLSQKLLVWLVGLLMAIAYAPLGPLMGVFIGFFPVSKVLHQPPTTVLKKILLGFFGFAVVVPVYLVLSKLTALLPEFAALNYIRYLAIALSVTEVVPWLWRRIERVR
ncbi:MAG: phosphatase PAP2 family protein [Limnothrix sp.]